MPRASVLQLLALCGLIACAPQYTSIAMGHYAEFRPYARVLSSMIDLELARPAYVAVIGITTPSPGYDERPVLFEPIYPRYDTDETHFAAGRHRIVSRQRSLREPPGCRGDEQPTLAGCRRRISLYPGAGGPVDFGNRYQTDPTHYIVIASEEFIDPYRLADQLFDIAFEREELSLALKTRKADRAGADLERALLDVPGWPIWSAFYVSGK